MKPHALMQNALVVLVALAALAFANDAQAQFYKGKTVTMIINYPAGGPTDIEGRIVAQHLPAHIAGKPTIVIKNVGGAGGVVGTNQLADAAPNGETMGFFTIDVVAQLLGNPALRANYADFLMLAAVEEPLVAYARKDTPPGLKVAADIMQANEFKALSLNAQNSNTLNQALSLDLLGLKYRPIPAYRGLKEVETAILQNEGQFANTSLPGWTGSVEPTMGELILPLWQLAPRGKDGGYPRSAALPDLPTFEEFYATVKGGTRPSSFTYEVRIDGPDGGDVPHRVDAPENAGRTSGAAAIRLRGIVEGPRLHPRLFQRGQDQAHPRDRRRGAADGGRAGQGQAGDQGLPARLQ